MRSITTGLMNLACGRKGLAAMCELSQVTVCDRSAEGVNGPLFFNSNDTRPFLSRHHSNATLSNGGLRSMFLVPSLCSKPAQGKVRGEHAGWQGERSAQNLQCFAGKLSGFSISFRGMIPRRRHGISVNGDRDAVSI